METNPIDSLKINIEGKAYFLHHSPREIPKGETLRTTGATQTTASDALRGYTYAWDAQTGLRDSVINQVSRRFDEESSEQYKTALQWTEDTDNPGNKNFFVHLTEADPENVFPDVNVPDSAARAIKGEGAQRVVDRVSIPAHFSNEEAIASVQEMLRNAGIPQLDPVSQRAKNLAMTISTRGQEALYDFEDIQGRTYLDRIVKDIHEAKSYELTDQLREILAVNDGPFAPMTDPITGRPMQIQLGMPRRTLAYEQGGVEGLLKHMSNEKRVVENLGRPATNYRRIV